MRKRCHPLPRSHIPRARNLLTGPRGRTGFRSNPPFRRRNGKGRPLARTIPRGPTDARPEPAALCAASGVPGGASARSTSSWLLGRRGGGRKGFTQADYAALLDAAHQQLSGAIVLVWDNLSTHTSKAMAELIAARPWLTVFRLPPYAHELNPVESVWSHLKRSLA